MAMREGAAPAVLTGQADMGSLGAQRTDRQRLGGGPIYCWAGDPLAGLDGGTFGVELASDLAVQMKAFRHRHEAAPDLSQQLDRCHRVAAAIIIGRGFKPGPGAPQPVGLVWAVAVGRSDL